MTVEIGRADAVDIRGLADADALDRCLTCSQLVYQGKVDGALACIWGLIPPTIMSNNAYIWLYTTEAASKHTFILVRYSQLMVEAMLKDFDALVGHCKIDDHRAIRWLRWLGAEFGEYQDRAIPFTIRRKNG